MLETIDLSKRIPKTVYKKPIGALALGPDELQAIRHDQDDADRDRSFRVRACLIAKPGGRL